jgi:hypothetical protein
MSSCGCLHSSLSLKWDLDPRTQWEREQKAYSCRNVSNLEEHGIRRLALSAASMSLELLTEEARLPQQDQYTCWLRHQIAYFLTTYLYVNVGVITFADHCSAYILTTRG